MQAIIWVDKPSQSLISTFLSHTPRRRNGRIQTNRDNGHFLEFSPSNRSSMARNFMFDDRDEENTNQGGKPPVMLNAPRNLSGEISQLTENAYDPQIKEMLEKMNGRLEELAGNGSVQKDQALQQQALELQIHHLHELQTAEKDKFQLEKTQLEQQLSVNQEQAAETIAQLEAAREQLTKEVAQLSKDKQEFQKRIQQLEQELQTASEQVTETQKLLQDLENESVLAQDKLLQECHSWESKHETLVQQMESTGASREELQSQVNDFARTVDDLQQQLLQAQQDASTANTELLTKSETNVELLQTKTRLEERLAHLQEELDRLRQQNETERGNFQKLNQDSVSAFDNMTKAAVDKDHKIASLFAQVGDLQHELQEERSRMQRDLEHLQTVKEQLTTQVEQLSAQLQETATSLRDLEQEKQALAEQLESSQSTASQHQESMQLDYQEQMETLQKQVDELNKALLESMAHVDEAEDEKSLLAAQLKQQQVAHQTVVEQHESAAATSKNEVEKLTWELEVACKELEKAESTLVSTELELSSLKNDYDSVDTNNTETRNLLDSMENSLANERLRREQAEQKVTQLEKDLATTTSERNAARENMQGFDEREEGLYQQLRESDRIRREMHAKLMQLMGNIRVFVRVRPALPGEAEEQAKRLAKHKRSRDVMEEESPFVYPQDNSLQDGTKNRLVVREPPKDRGGLKDRRKKWDYAFDQVFSPTSTQQDVWESAEPLIQCTVDGFNVTLFAYGQTGSGKTHTMLGEPGNEGLIARAVHKLFVAKDQLESMHTNCQVNLSVELLEVYNEKVRDLLANGRQGEEIEVKVTSHQVVGNITMDTTSEEQVLEILELAQSRRCVKATASNAESSRSHLLFTIHFDVEMGGKLRRGKLNVCDLAGSERLSKSGAHMVGGSLLKETQHINKSLSVLSNVIERLQTGETQNVPFRESKLTFLLKDSLSGNSKTLAIVCCNPLSSHFGESLGSLRFAEKVNRVDLKATANFSC